MTSIQQSSKATTVKTAFSRETAVSTDIHADASIIWALLTNAPDFSRWNSTVVSIEGDIKPGATIKLKSTLDEKRVFKLKVKEFQPPHRLAWGDAMGTRVYELKQMDANTTRFSMTEKIGGLLFPLFSRFIPSFDEAFNQFAADLKKEAEAIHNSAS